MVTYARDTFTGACFHDPLKIMHCKCYFTPDRASHQFVTLLETSLLDSLSNQVDLLELWGIEISSIYNTVLLDIQQLHERKIPPLHSKAYKNEGHPHYSVCFYAF